jgi:hypothetical protein
METDDKNMPGLRAAVYGGGKHADLLRRPLSKAKMDDYASENPKDMPSMR